MSCHDFTPATREGRIGKAIYLAALSYRRGFRDDQLDIDDNIWTEIFEDIGHAAVAAVALDWPLPPTTEAA